jgi:non-specific serine/threonine protein kinase/serine/threonine-protein kinase
MDTPDWDDIETLFAEAMELAPGERAALLDARCGGRTELRAEVEALLASHDGSGDFLGSMTGPPRNPLADAPSLLGQTMGRYRLLERVGEGGMGVVYRGERADGQFAEQVAVKLIPLAIANTDTLRRFRIERQVLATLNHPDIVTLIDGGMTDTGQAYLAMKYVDGVPITEYCARQSLPLDDRLRLYQRVCGAVQHAHRTGVVHRDLKPANILVTADGTPKVLDFGVAKLLDRSDPGVEVTETGMLRPLTPNYASPEQLRGLPVTTACDIYALGVLLHELIAGVRPYEVAGTPIDEMLATVIDRPRSRPSAMAARERLPYDPRRLQGDLDAIVLKAMSQDPSRRYAAAQELSNDIGRHLARQPVIARPPSLAYLAASLARRHRAAFAAAAVSLAALVAALGVSIWQTRAARAERDRAAARFNDTRQLAMALILKIHDEVRPLAGSTPVRQSIVKEALTYLERLSADPAADAALRIEMARAYHRIGEVQGRPNVPNLGDRQGAMTSLRKALALLRPLVSDPQMAPDAAPEFVRAQIAFSSVARAAGLHDEAHAATGEGIAIAERLVQASPRDRQARRLLGTVYFDMAIVASPESALPRWLRTGEVFESLLAEAPDDPDAQRNVALVQKYLGGHYHELGQLDQALQHYQRALALDRRRADAAPGNHVTQIDLAIDLGNVASIHRDAGRLEEAIGGFEESRDIRRRLTESDPQNDYARSRLAFALATLARAYSKAGRHADALSHAREAVTISEARAAVDSVELIDYLTGLAQIERAAGRLDRSCPPARRAAALADKTLIPSNYGRIRGQLTESLDACTSRDR